MSFGSGAIAKLQIIGLGFFDFFDGIASLCMCLGAILMLAYIIFRWGFKKFKEEANAGAIGKIRIYDWMKPYLCYISQVYFIISFISAMAAVSLLIYWLNSASSVFLQPSYSEITSA